jgi:hypothetical protein
LNGQPLRSQADFVIRGNAKKVTVDFELKSNLIIIPIEVNGKDLNFVLDSGVGATILFNLDARDSLSLNKLQPVKLQGLGSEDPVDAILSESNEFRIKSIYSPSQRLYVISNDNFDMSSKVGMTIHGIIGYELLKNFVVRVNYSTKRLSIFDPGKFTYKDCRSCETFNLEFHNLKPYINVGVQVDSIRETITPVKLLIDSGGSDAMWLFEGSKPELKPPSKYFRDFLGEGLSGAIYGKRSKIKGLILGQFSFKNPTVSFPDSTSVAYAMRFKERNGSIGGTVLKRFIVTFDYPGNTFALKKGVHFKEPFRYNMSGIELAHNGKVLVQEKDETTFSLIDGSGTTKNTRVNLDYRYKFTFKPSYIIHKLRLGSPAHEAGLLPGDIIVKVNGKSAFDMGMDEIVQRFYDKEGKKVTLMVERYGQHYVYHFRLRDMLQ